MSEMYMKGSLGKEWCSSQNGLRPAVPMRRESPLSYERLLSSELASLQKCQIFEEFWTRTKRMRVWFLELKN